MKGVKISTFLNIYSSKVIDCIYKVDVVTVTSPIGLWTAILVFSRRHLGFWPSPSWFLAATILVLSHRHLGINPSWVLVVAILVFSLRHLGF